MRTTRFAMQTRLFILLLTATACAHTPRDKLRSEVDDFAKRLPPCTVDVDASEVWIGARWEGNLSLPFEGDAATWRDAIADAVGRACVPSRETAEPVRFRVYVDADITDGSFISVMTPFQIVAAILFIPIGAAGADVQLEYEYRGVVYRALGHGHAMQGLFFNFEPSVPAFGEALQNAIEDIARQVSP